MGLALALFLGLGAGPEFILGLCLALDSGSASPRMGLFNGSGICPTRFCGLGSSFLFVSFLYFCMLFFVI